MLTQEEINQNSPKKVAPRDRFAVYLSFVLVVPLVVYVRRKKQINRMITNINQANNNLNKKISQRRELLLKLVDTTKQEIRWQRDILMQITKLRNINLNSLSMKKKIDFSQKLDKLAQDIEHHIEQNVDWKSHIDNHEIPKEIKRVETELLKSQEIYNSQVLNYNKFIQNRTTNLIANKMGVGNKKLFETSPVDAFEE